MNATAWFDPVARLRARRDHLDWLLRSWRANAADRSGRSFVYEHPALGPFVYHPGWWLSRRLYLFGAFEPREVQFAAAHASRGGLVVDVGANIGVFAAVCARAAAGHGRVLALEPHPGTCARLVRTCEMLGLSNVDVTQAAAGSRTGHARLVDAPSGHDVHRHLQDSRPDARGDDVDVVRLDDVCGTAIDQVVVVKVDVEGHELDVLDGAPRLLASGRAAWIVEFSADALAAAGASTEQLWTRLDETHECVDATGADFPTAPPTREDVLSAAAGAIVNTMWVPRAERT
jgi:FkbM family methyltransferase